MARLLLNEILSGEEQEDLHPAPGARLTSIQIHPSDLHPAPSGAVDPGKADASSFADPPEAVRSGMDSPSRSPSGSSLGSRSASFHSIASSHAEKDDHDPAGVLFYFSSKQRKEFVKEFVRTSTGKKLLDDYVLEVLIGEGEVKEKPPRAALKDALEKFEGVKPAVSWDGASVNNVDWYMKYFTTLRGLLGRGLGFHSLRRRLHQNFGARFANEWGDKRTYMSVPYMAADTPSPRAEFSQPDIRLLFTYIHYYSEGLPREHFERMMRQLSGYRPGEEDEEEDLEEEGKSRMKEEDRIWLRAVIGPMNRLERQRRNVCLEQSIKEILKEFKGKRPLPRVGDPVVLDEDGSWLDDSAAQPPRWANTDSKEELLEELGIFLGLFEGPKEEEDEAAAPAEQQEARNELQRGLSERVNQAWKQCEKAGAVLTPERVEQLFQPKGKLETLFADRWHKNLKMSVHVVHYFLSKTLGEKDFTDVMGEKDMQVFPTKMQAVPDDLVTPFPKTSGFTGTTDTELLLPLQTRLLESLKHTDATMIKRLIEDEDRMPGGSSHTFSPKVIFVP